MKVAILSDIHANAHALDEVLSAASKSGVERLVLLGDYVGYYYQPRDVIAMLMDWDHIAILGNHDRMALEARENAALRQAYREKYGSSLDVALDELDATAWNWLESLPLQRRIELGAWSVHLAHGAPFDDDAYIYPDSPEALLERTRASSDANAIWLGNTHWPFHSIGRPALLNPGSVGQPRDIGGMASWCLFDTARGTIAHRRTAFDTQALIADCHARDPGLPRLAEVLTRRAAPKNRPGDENA